LHLNWKRHHSNPEDHSPFQLCILLGCQFQRYSATTLANTHVKSLTAFQVHRVATSACQLRDLRWIGVGERAGQRFVLNLVREGHMPVNMAHKLHVDPVNRLAPSAVCLAASVRRRQTDLARAADLAGQPHPRCTLAFPTHEA
jgi:hypothetical protein